MLKKILALGILLCLFSLAYAQEEKITITTYYPSPYGSYRELRSQRMAIGETYINHSDVCWEGDTGCSGSPMIPSASDVDLIVQGKVGIGTTNPTKRLVVGNGGFQLLNGGQPGIYESSSFIADFDSASNQATRFWSIGNTSTKGRYDFYIGDSNIPSNQIRAMTIANDGNVGIGANPMSKLDVEGGVAVGAVYSGTSAAPTNGMIVQGNVGIGMTNPGAKLHVSGGHIQIEDRGDNCCAPLVMNDNGYQTHLYSYNNGDFQIHKYGAGSISGAALTIKNAGNVGIGTTSPGAKLEVAGQIKITGGSPGANKVLTSDATGLASWATSGGTLSCYIQSSTADNPLVCCNSGDYAVGFNQPENGFRGYWTNTGCVQFSACSGSEVKQVMCCK